jgi:uncharacterized protein YndB with AHSA1/START domain
MMNAVDVGTRISLPDDRSIVLVRHFAGPPAQVFDAWTDPERVRRWYGCATQSMTECAIDLREGGAWRWTLRDEEGEEHAFSGVYRVVARPDSLIFTERYEQIPGSDHVVSLKFSPRETGSTLVMRIEHASKEARDAHLRSGMEAGMEDMFARLDAAATCGRTDASTSPWRMLTSDGSVRWLAYSFGPGHAGSLAVQCGAGEWLVVSPPSGATPEVYDALAGDVVALIAPNAYHHRGQQAWRARFPHAQSYAPSGAMTRLARVSRDVPYRPLDDLVLPAHIAVVAPAGQKQPDILLRIDVMGEVIWWLGELFSNVAKSEQTWPLRLLSRFIGGSGLGYRRNRRPGLVYVRDANAWLASVRAAVQPAPPTIAVPAHGTPVVDDAARRTLSLLEPGTNAAV